MHNNFVSIPPKTLAEPITSGASSFKLNDILKWDSSTDLAASDFGDTLYAVFRNNTNTKIEIMKLNPATIADDSITISLRGLRDTGTPDDTEVSANKLDWNANETIVELGTNPPQLYYQFLNKNDDQTIDSVKTFKNTKRPIMDSDVDATDDKEYVTLGQLNRTALGTTLTNRLAMNATAGETIASGDVIYFKESDQEWYKTDASTSATCRGVKIGIAQGAGTDGAGISGGVLIDGLDQTQTGMTPGAKQYISDTPGELSETAGTIEVLVGVTGDIATELMFQHLYDIESVTADEKDALAGTYSESPDANNKFVNNPLVSSHTANTAGYLTGGTNAESNYIIWAAITDGSCRATIDGSTANYDGINLSTATSMVDVATLLETALGITCAWDTDHFIFTSTTSNEDSEVSVFSTSTGTVGTDISTPTYSDCDSTNAVATQGTSDHDKVVKLDTDGKIDKSFDSLNIKVLTAGETINGETLPQPAFIAKEQTVEAMSINFEDTDTNRVVYGANWEAQSVTSDADDNKLTKVSLNIRKVNSPSGNVTVSIYREDGSGKPTGSILASKSLPASGLSSSYTWEDFEFASELLISPSTKYVIVVSAPSADGANYITWTADESSPSYTGGARAYSSNSGGSWSVASGTDMNFRWYSRIDPYTSFVGTEGRLYNCDANDIDKINFKGFAITTATTGNDIVFQTNGIVSGFTGLEEDEDYYVQDDGTIGLDKGTYEIKVGVAISETELLIMKGSFEYIGSASGTSITVPNITRFVVVVLYLSGTYLPIKGEVTLSLKGKLSGTITHITSAENGATPHSTATATATWSGSTITITKTSVHTTVSGTAYFYT